MFQGEEITLSEYEYIDAPSLSRHNSFQITDRAQLQQSGNTCWLHAMAYFKACIYKNSTKADSIYMETINKYSSQISDKENGLDAGRIAHYMQQESTNFKNDYLQGDNLTYKNVYEYVLKELKNGLPSLLAYEVPGTVGHAVVAIGVSRDGKIKVVDSNFQGVVQLLDDNTKFFLVLNGVHK